MTAPAAAEDGSSSHRQIIRSSAIIGSAAVLTNALGVLRLKVAALLLGPVGVGLIGLYLNFVSTASMIGGLGLNTSGVREIADADATGNRQLLAARVRVLFVATFVLAATSAATIWVARRSIAHLLLSQRSLSEPIGWLSIAVGFTIVSVLPVTLLNGFRRIGALAAVQILGGLLGTVAGLGILFVWHGDGLIGYVIAAPTAAAFVGIVALLRWGLPSPDLLAPGLRSGQTFRLLRLGGAVMLGGVLLSLGVLLIRAHIYARLGAVPLGHFAAAWMISNVYLIFVIQALGTDFFPRISRVVSNGPTTVRLIDEQLETSILLALPALLATQAVVPWLLRALYSEAFAPAAELLRWQILGDLFKVLSYPLIMSVLAARRGTLYFLIELSVAVLYVVFVWMMTDRLGLLAAGIGYLVMYVVYFVVLVAVTHKLHEYVLGASASKAASAAVAITLVVTAASLMSDLLGLAVGLAAAVMSGVWTLRRLRQLGALPARLVRFVALFSGSR